MIYLLAIQPLIKKVSRQEYSLLVWIKIGLIARQPTYG